MRALQRPGNKSRGHSRSPERELSSFKKIRIAVANRNVIRSPGKAVYVPSADPAGDTWKIHSRYCDSDGKSAHVELIPERQGHGQMVSRRKRPAQPNIYPTGMRKSTKMTARWGGADVRSAFDPKQTFDL